MSGAAHLQPARRWPATTRRSAGPSPPRMPTASKPSTLTASSRHAAENAIHDRATKAVTDKYRISRDAAAQRVRRARQAGYLPATEPGKAS